MEALRDWRKVLDGPFVGQPHVGADLAIASTRLPSLECVLLHQSGDVWRIGEQPGPGVRLPGWRAAINLGGRGLITEAFYATGYPMGRGSDNRLYWHDNGRWTLHDAIGQFPAGGVHPSGKLGRGLNNKVWVQSYAGENQPPWMDLGGDFRGRPDWIEGVAVVARGKDDAVWINEASERDYRYSGWRSLGGQIAGNPVVVGLPYVRFPNPAPVVPDRMMVLARGAGDNHLWMCQRVAGSGWESWRDMGGDFQGSPAVAQIEGSDRLYCFVRGRDNHLHCLSFANNKWNQWQNCGGGIRSDPVAESLFTDSEGVRLRVLALGEEGALWERTLV